MISTMFQFSFFEILFATTPAFVAGFLAYIRQQPTMSSAMFGIRVTFWCSLLFGGLLGFATADFSDFDFSRMLSVMVASLLCGTLFLSFPAIAVVALVNRVRKTTVAPNVPRSDADETGNPYQPPLNQ